MRANIPTDDLSATLPPENDSSKAEVTREQIELANIGNAPNWEIIVDYLNARIDIYKNGLFGEDLSKQDTSIIGQRFLAAQSVISEFQSLIDQVNQNTEIVNEVFKDESVRPE